MTVEQDPALAAISGFFARGVAVGLHLPDGWYGGRPMENHHELTFLQRRPARLILELDERILLTFTGEDISVKAVDSDLLDPARTPSVEFDGFSQLVVDALPYAGAGVSATIYNDGRVQLISAS
jgi:hypothetical protein